ncbi:hypothetical protein BDB00DRAFT_871976 [Zychaea mexicana]|uniref:uncharacterized protein n=1 Tax=Zychaea mexicana TaxID=64656 RepID=UPI0022FE9763|nr:uncharacterized protein BDB00DRAFT_871976 [Zychaea mexicana]KAI9493729.1 hypothetical protein BDB00DRAFT_871976 [Zychaea mexicana]
MLPKKRRHRISSFLNLSVVSLWQAWQEFVAGDKNDDLRNVYKPELYGVCWCGQGFEKREDMPLDLYQGIQEQVDSIEDTEMAVEAFPVTNMAPELRYKAYFIKDLFSPLTKAVFTDVTDVGESQSSWNVGVLFPMMQACARYIRLANGRTITFVPGEAPLQAMANIGVATTATPYRRNSPSLKSQ